MTLRVVSLVPSLTETMLDCGVEVVGRTRFCIHPVDKVAGIPVVGGTKNANWQTIRNLKPGLVVMDREENTRELADACPFPWVATHIISMETLGHELVMLAGELGNDALRNLADNWLALASGPPPTFGGWADLPGVQALIGEPREGYDRIEYMIWKQPWMAVGRETFIGSMLARVGLGPYLAKHDSKYPEIGEGELPRDDTFYLFSSEPYPFGRHVDELRQLGFTGALVDGEFYAWFGSRSYRMLKNYLEARS